MMVTSRKSFSPAVRGALLAAAAGDALGWPQELRGGLIGGQRARDKAAPEPRFRRWTRYAGQYTRRHEDDVLPGEYSDDTQLLLAVARACRFGDRWLDHLTGVELPTWPLYQRGGGGAVLSAANSWADERPPWVTGPTARAAKTWQRYANAGANGVAMRIAPHAVVAANHDDLLDRVFQDGLATHGHPRALIGAMTYAVTLHGVFAVRKSLGFGDLVDAARDGLVPPDRVMHMLPKDWGDEGAKTRFAEAWTATNHEMTQQFDGIARSLQRGAMSNHLSTFEELGCMNPKINGAGTVTAAAAIYAASRFAARPMFGLLATAFLSKGDTDTLASMTGGLLGALHSEPWLNDLAIKVQDAGYLEEIGEALALGYGVGNATPHPGFDHLRKQWQLAVRQAEFPPEGHFPDGRRFVTVGVDEIRKDMRRIRIRLEDGQTAVIDAAVVVRRGVEDQPRDARISNTVLDGERDQSRPPGSLTSVTGFTPDLNRATAYYARLMGREMDLRADEARVTEWFVLREPAGPIDTTGSGMGLTIAVTDLQAAADRMGVNRPPPNATHFNTRDPDGRYVRVEAYRGGSPSN